MRLKISALKINFDLKIWKDYSDKDVVYGIESTIHSKGEWHESHILLIDYDDNLTLNNLIKEVKRLQKAYKLGDCHLFESSFNHFHCMFFGDNLNYFDALRIIHDTPCCKEFKKWRMLRQSMTLRLSPKNNGRVPKLIKVIPGEHKELSDKQETMRDFVLGYCKKSITISEAI